MKVCIEFTDAEIGNAVDAGLGRHDLYEIGLEDVIDRKHLEEFMRAALERLFPPALPESQK